MWGAALALPCPPPLLKLQGSSCLSLIKLPEVLKTCVTLQPRRALTLPTGTQTHYLLLAELLGRILRSQLPKNTGSLENVHIT